MLQPHVLYVCAVADTAPITQFVLGVLFSLTPDIPGWTASVLL